MAAQRTSTVFHRHNVHFTTRIRAAIRIAYSTQMIPISIAPNLAIPKAALRRNSG